MVNYATLPFAIMQKPHQLWTLLFIGDGAYGFDSVYYMKKEKLTYPSSLISIKKARKKRVDLRQELRGDEPQQMSHSANHVDAEQNAPEEESDAERHSDGNDEPEIECQFVARVHQINENLKEKRKGK